MLLTDFIELWQYGLETVKKAESEKKRNWLKVKVTGQSQKCQKIIKNYSFHALTSITQNILGRY